MLVTVPVEHSIGHKRFFRVKVFVEMSANHNIYSRQQHSFLYEIHISRADND